MNELTALLLSMNDEPEVRDSYIRAPFAYPGSKYSSRHQIIPYLPVRKKYCEPCAGTGAILLARKESPLEVLNDRHSGITCFYRCIRDSDKCLALMERLNLTVHSREEFIWSRDTWEHKVENDVERAARWYYCVHTSFAGKGWAFGRSTNSQAQTGRALRNNIKEFPRIHERLKNVQIENLDWRIIFKDYDSDDMVWYVDPPYLGTYAMYDNEWKEHDHIELCERIQRLQGFIAVSGYDFPEHPYNKFKWDNKIKWNVSSTIAGHAFTDTNHLQGKEGEMYRGGVEETLWIRESK